MSGNQDFLLGLRKYVSPEILYGREAVRMVGFYATNFGFTKVLIVTDQGILKTEIVANIQKNLEEAKIPFAVFHGISPNPTKAEIMNGVGMLKQEGCDGIIAVGGGSPIDSAKSIGVAYANDKNITEFGGIDNIPMPGPPIICIPTTAGTSADISQFAMVTDENKKITIISKTLVPDVSIIDPMLTKGLTKNMTITGAFTSLAHAIEAYASNVSSYITDMHALEAIHLINTNLPLAIKHLDNIDFRDNLMTASLLAGLAFSNASLGLTHAMAHSFCATFKAPIGIVNLLLLEHVIDFNFDAAPEKYIQMGQAMGVQSGRMSQEEQKFAVMEAIASLRRSMGVELTLKEFNVRPGDLTTMAELAVHDYCMVTNPKQATTKQIEEIYGKAIG